MLDIRQLTVNNIVLIAVCCFASTFGSGERCPSDHSDLYRLSSCGMEMVENTVYDEKMDLPMQSKQIQLLAIVLIVYKNLPNTS